MPIEHIELLAKRHAEARATLAERVRDLEEELEVIKRRRIPGIKAAVSAAKDSRIKLHAAIDDERGLFARPRTRVLHGIKVGLQKAKGKLVFGSAEQMVKLIRKHMAEQFDALVNVKETPVKKALLNLPATDLKRIGCTVEDTGDEVMIAAADGDIDKLVDALLGDAKADGDAEDEAA